MSHLHIQQLAQVETDFRSVERAVVRVLADPSLPGYGALTTAAHGLETVYIVWLFTEFEILLRDALLIHSLRPLPRAAYSLINRSARLFGVPDPIRDRVHFARDYRNSVVHTNGQRTLALTFKKEPTSPVARSSLRVFLPKREEKETMRLFS